MSKLVFRRFVYATRRYGTVKSVSVVSNGTGLKQNGPHENGKDTTLCFDDYKTVFRSKTTSELFRALFVLKLSSFETLVTHSEGILKAMQKYLGKRLFEKIMEATMYGHFVAGSDLKTLRQTTELLKKDGIRPLVLIPIEEDSSEKQGPEERYDDNAARIIEGQNMMGTLREPGITSMTHMKLTSVLPGVLCEKISSIYKNPLAVEGLVEKMAAAIENKQEGTIPGLTAAEQQTVNRSFIRIRNIVKSCVEQDVVLMIDAEQTYLNPALNMLTLAMMLVGNKEKPLIWYTYQNYQKGMTEKLKMDTEFVRSHNRCFGAKIVRGAYMDQERSLAAEHGYPSPINDTFEDTTKTYYNSVDYIFKKAIKEPEHINVIVGSHNEETILWALKRMKEMNFPPDFKSVVFGQVQGIGDHISCALGQAGYPIYKSIPCGTLDDTLMYLARRAKENRSTLLLMKNDAYLLRTALLDRLTPKFLKT